MYINIKRKVRMFPFFKSLRENKLLIKNLMKTIS